MAGLSSDEVSGLGVTPIERHALSSFDEPDHGIPWLVPRQDCQPPFSMVNASVACSRDRLQRPSVAHLEGAQKAVFLDPPA